MRQYRIAFFTADWNYELVETTLQGLKRYVDDHENVHLCVFDCFGKDQDTPKDRSEYAIFNLPDLREFDGLLVQSSQIVLNRVRQEITRRIALSGIPTVTIDCPIEGGTLISVDNRRAMRDITDHVIRTHGARRLAHLTGILENGCPEGQQRRDGFLDACRENGIPRENVEIIPCTWRTSDGIRVAHSFLKAGRPLPDAFVCANDEMALGVIEALNEGGVRVPEDVIVTGFDNLSSSELSSPRLSTVDRDLTQLNYTALDLLIEKIEGREARESVPFDYKVILSESCGCHAPDHQETIRMKYFQQTRFLKNFYIHQDQMAEELFDVSSLRNLKGILQKNHGIFGCDNVYLCINDYYFDNYDKSKWHHDSETFGDEMVLTVCGRKGEDPEMDRFTRFSTRKLLPDAIMASSRFLVFYPLHYNTYSIGYLVMDGISEAAKLNLHKSIFSFLEIAIENVRKKGLLHQLNDELDDLYVRDALTGLYNRFGYARYGNETYKRLMDEEGGARVLFIDMDDMKGINDCFGHEYGDAAICATARILKDIATPRDFLMRYGGDEFLMIASRKGDLEGDIDRGVEAYNRASDMPFKLCLSIGIIESDGRDGEALDQLVQAADAEMYACKSRHKRDARQS